MRSGQFDTQISVWQKSKMQNADFGTEVVEWVPLVALPGSPVLPERFWAEVQDVLPSRAESVRNGLTVARNQTRIRMRYRNDINSTMRITVYRDTEVVYEIVGGPAQIHGRQGAIEMVCERVTSADGNGA